MKSTILKTASSYLLPILLLFSIFILLRGHYHPGGGFVGGLIAAIAFVLHSFTHGNTATLKLLNIHPTAFIPIGLGLAALSMFAPMLAGDPVMTGLWFDEPFTVIGMIGSTLFFDLGVYFVVIGVALTILITIAQHSE